ncbi:MAG: hypothetical protein ACLTLE_05195 [Lachnospiraceae bacterium]
MTLKKMFAAEDDAEAGDGIVEEAIARIRGGLAVRKEAKCIRIPE